jgi:hypothetical protein
MKCQGLVTHHIAEEQNPHVEVLFIRCGFFHLQALSRWQVGAPCRAVYSADGAVYEAVIDAIFYDKGTCIIKYIGK